MPRFGRPTKTEKLAAQIAEQLKGLQGSPLGNSGYATATPAEPYANSGGQGIVQVAGEIVPLQRPGGGSDGFGAILGPAAPLIPALIDEPLDATGRPLPRRYEYQVAQNLNLTQTEVPFAILRRLTEQCDVIHRCIEIRISDIQKQDWSFGPSDKALTAIMEEQNVSHSKAAQIFREQYGEQMVRLQEFWENPYVHTDRGWNEWISEFLWQHFAFDGVPVYPRYTLGGDVLGFDIIDSPTIKVLLDNRGDIPYPPQPAYQQVLWGFPRGEFVATPNSQADGEFVDAMKGRIGRTDSLAYFVRNRRTWSPYGYSHVEECIPAATLYLERQSWMRNEYQSGATPMTWMRTNSQELDIRKLQEFERILNDKLTGSTVERHRVKVLPDGFEPVAMPSIDERYKPEYDEYIIKQIASKFGVSPTQLGIIPRQGLGGKGQQDGESDQAETVSGRPTANFIIEVINSLSKRFLGMDKAITFQLSDNESAKDEEAKFKGYQISLYSGTMTLNDVRGELGLPLYDMPEADEPMIVAGNQVQFLKGLLETDGSGEVTGARQNLPSNANPEPTVEEGQESKPEGGAQVSQPEGEAAKREKPSDEAGLELRAFAKYAAARIKKGGAYRDFQFRAIPEDDAYALNQDVLAVIKGETYTPPKGVQEAAKRALEWIADGKAGDGFTDVGRKRASDLARGAGVSITTVRRMKAYFDRHQGDKDATGFSSGEDGFPSPGRVAWDAWGGDAGYSWVKDVLGSKDKAAAPSDTPKDGGLTKEFNPDQPRDEHGRWGDGSGSNSSSRGVGPEYGRADVGQFQLNEQNCAHLNEVYNAAGKASGFPAYREEYETAGQNAVQVEMAKMLGMDGAASIQSDPYGDERPSLFRGCDQAGADSLTGELASYGGSGGTLVGSGVYTSPNVGVANEFAQQGGVRVDCWVASDANIATLSEEAMNSTDFGFGWPDTTGWSQEAQSGMSQAMRTPASAALAHGYQGLDATNITGQQATVIFDRSVLSIYVNKVG